MEHLISLRKQHLKRQTAGSETVVMQSKSRGYTECLQQRWSNVLQKTFNGVTTRRFSVLARCESPLAACSKQEQRRRACVRA